MPRWTNYPCAFRNRACFSINATIAPDSVRRACTGARASLRRSTLIRKLIRKSRQIIRTIDARAVGEKATLTSTLEAYQRAIILSTYTSARGIAAASIRAARKSTWNWEINFDSRPSFSRAHFHDRGGDIARDMNLFLISGAAHQDLSVVEFLPRSLPRTSFLRWFYFRG